MPKTDLISKERQEFSEQLNVLITSYTFQNIVLHFWMFFTVKCFHWSLQWLFALCGILWKELNNLQAQKGKIVEIKPMKGFFFFFGVLLIFHEKQPLSSWKTTFIISKCLLFPCTFSKDEKKFGLNRMMDVGKDLWISSGPTILKQRHLEQADQELLKFLREPLWATYSRSSSTTLLTIAS